MGTKQRRELALIWWSLFIIWLMITVSLSGQDGTGSAMLSNTISAGPWRLIHRCFPQLRYEDYHLCVRKLAHFGVHFVLAFLALRAMRYTFSHFGVALIVVAIVTVIIAIFDEAIQVQTPGRVGIISDAVINLAGVFAGIFVSSFFKLAR